MARTPRESVHGAFTEYETQISPEARCANDTDKLECFVHASQYRLVSYYGVEDWIDSSCVVPRTHTARCTGRARPACVTDCWCNR
jgi:hypothetical protein